MTPTEIQELHNSQTQVMEKTCVINDISVRGIQHDVYMLNGTMSNKWRKSINSVEVEKNIEQAITIKEWIDAQEMDPTCKRIREIIKRAKRDQKSPQNGPRPSQELPGRAQDRKTDSWLRTNKNE